MKENYAVNDWEKSSSDQSVDKCISFVTSSSDDQLIDTSGLKCSKHAAKFVYCMWKEYFMSCPTDKQNTDNKRCEKMRQKMGKSTSGPF